MAEESTLKMLQLLRQQQEMVTEIGNWLFRIAEYLNRTGLAVPIPSSAAPRFIRDESSFLAVCVSIRNHIDELIRNARGAKSSATEAARPQEPSSNT